jgi:hypothetical protein
MTISIAWVRSQSNTPELVFASDSRLSGGGNIDHCQKVFPLPREDCCIAFAGSTAIAYPFIHQLQNTISDYKKVFDRAVDVTLLRGRVVGLLNRFVGAHVNYVAADLHDDLATTSFLFGGWSWRQARFYVWRIHYDQGAKKYVVASTGMSRALGMTDSNFAEIGIVGDYRGPLIQGLRTALEGKIEKLEGEGPVRLNYEPLQVLAGMLANPEYTDRARELRGLIGGGPQVVKVYPFMRTMHYAVEWNDGKKPAFIIKGRAIADFEVIDALSINPATGIVARPRRNKGLRDRTDPNLDFPERPLMPAMLPAMAGQHVKVPVEDGADDDIDL